MHYPLSSLYSLTQYQDIPPGTDLFFFIYPRCYEMYYKNPQQALYYKKLLTLDYKSSTRLDDKNSRVLNCNKFAAIRIKLYTARVCVRIRESKGLYLTPLEGTSFDDAQCEKYEIQRRIAKETATFEHEQFGNDDSSQSQLLNDNSNSIQHSQFSEVRKNNPAVWRTNRCNKNHNSKARETAVVIQKRKTDPKERDNFLSSTKIFVRIL
ncbi:hypothetical protein DINM_006157 [Dirofilaria immitis]|nr:hypothetical protein [Dirofilaria immitis]